MDKQPKLSKGRVRKEMPARGTNAHQAPQLQGLTRTCVLQWIVVQFFLAVKGLTCISGLPLAGVIGGSRTTEGPLGLHETSQKTEILMSVETVSDKDSLLRFDQRLYTVSMTKHVHSFNFWGRTRTFHSDFLVRSAGPSRHYHSAAPLLIAHWDARVLMGALSLHHVPRPYFQTFTP